MASVRKAAYAGRFYPAERDACLRMIDTMEPRTPSSHVYGGIVPHAGWPYSGAIAYETISSLEPAALDTVVVFGAVHVQDRNASSVFPEGLWETPLGPVPVDGELAEAVGGDACRLDADPHRHEHSIEVELPLMRHWFGVRIRVLPVMVRPGPRAGDVGRAVANAAGRLGRKVAYFASTDLTHYGPGFGFEPAGRGAVGVQWAMEVNDRSFLERLSKLEPEGVVEEAQVRRNACGAGAVAAMLGALAGRPGLRLEVLSHTCSAWVRGESEPLDSVGYAAAVLVGP